MLWCISVVPHGNICCLHYIKPYLSIPSHFPSVSLVSFSSTTSLIHFFSPSLHPSSLLFPSPITHHPTRTHSHTHECTHPPQEIHPNSPAAQAGLIPHSDYILGSEIMTSGDDDLYSLIESHDHQEIKLYVYNADTGNCREVSTRITACQHSEGCSSWC